MAEQELQLLTTPRMPPGRIQCVGDLMEYYKERTFPGKTLPRVSIPMKLFVKLNSLPDGVLGKITSTELMLFEEPPDDPVTGPPTAIDAFFTLESDFPGGAFCQHFSESMDPADPECQALLACLQELSNSCFELRQIWAGRRFRFVDLAAIE